VDVGRAVLVANNICTQYDNVGSACQGVVGEMEADGKKVSSQSFKSTKNP
jgi:hypothetical protein